MEKTGTMVDAMAMERGAGKENSAAMKLSKTHLPTICAEETFLSPLMSSTCKTQIVTKGKDNELHL